jgi:hypothetical protein
VTSFHFGPSRGTPADCRASLLNNAGPDLAYSRRPGIAQSMVTLQIRLFWLPIVNSTSFAVASPHSPLSNGGNTCLSIMQLRAVIAFPFLPRHHVKAACVIGSGSIESSVRVFASSPVWFPPQGLSSAILLRFRICLPADGR